MTNPRKLYWDSSCFICFLDGSEEERRLICEDILQHANDGDVEIWYSVWVIVEVVRPKKPGNSPLPEWAAKAIASVPEAQAPLEELWRRYQRSAPTRKLSDAQIARIQAMFEWPFLKPIYIDLRTAQKAVELARDRGLKPGDALHAASAILAKCDAIQRWDRDFDRVNDLIASEEPQRISSQGALAFPAKIGPAPEDFKDDQNQSEAAPQDAAESAEGRTDVSEIAEGPANPTRRIRFEKTAGQVSTTDEPNPAAEKGPVKGNS